MTTARKVVSQQQLYAAAVCIAAAICIRVMVSVWGYSGLGVPPMFGDFEAQRHWLEITTNLRIGDWYRNTTENDLLYWGLDYPPLTAYHSYALGSIAKYVHPPLVELYESRGYESIIGKTFMRVSVVLSDLIVLFPALFLAFYSLHSSQIKSGKAWSTHSWTTLIELLSCLIAPGIVLIDHGHFQYNGKRYMKRDMKRYEMKRYEMKRCEEM